jgi:hypothetical protein
MTKIVFSENRNKFNVLTLSLSTGFYQQLWGGFDPKMDSGHRVGKWGLLSPRNAGINVIVLRLELIGVQRNQCYYQYYLQLIVFGCVVGIGM